ncbi:hypothetical protein D3C80_997770 [compost metagenome]
MALQQDFLQPLILDRITTILLAILLVLTIIVKTGIQDPNKQVFGETGESFGIVGIVTLLLLIGRLKSY